MKKLIIGIMFAVAAGALLPAFAAGAAFTYQGVIKEVGGTVPANKNRTVEFRIYDGPGTSAQVLWGRAYSVLLDANGLFNTALTDAAGSTINGVTGTGLAQVLAANAGTTLYIGLTVDNSSGEISPRQSLLAVPYAIHAADAAAASGEFTVEGKTTLKGGLEVTSGNVTVPTLETSSLVVNGNVTASTSGSFAGYGTIPVRGIILWSGASNEVPDGWKLCDGQNGTPDLRNRFVVGAGGEYQVGETGGAKTVTLTVDQIPPHKHNSQVRTVGYAAAFNNSKEAATHDDSSKNNGGKNIISDSTGGGQAHENRPPFYALCYIMRVK